MRTRSKIRDFFSTLFILTLMAGGSVWLAKQNEVNLKGQYKIIDGDSLIVNGQEIRLLGIDAPEYRQECSLKDGSSYPCGKRSRAHLSKFAKSGELNCKGWEEDKYQRLLAICYANSLELNSQMVLDGWAVSYGDYEREEADAQKRNAGVWQGDFESPSSWRESAKEAHSISFLSNFSLW